jgi:glycosyltransferase involved in cell wall biosynthesis
MARTLAGALMDDAERERRGIAARQLARSRFSWSFIAGDLLQLYRAMSSTRS